ncbi:putative RNA polymerase sigma factor FecI [Achromobacter veterisilvae]|uniref:Putative RNA polymerase sigma factor FecI n=1 Tax=Achromobacter veterisilvae TaxID=2069367 RepID=A0A446CDI1_9BURK|nr:sigma-70 family RNA polymerase sigma factor [Achromobacter veterisilvae]SSW65901.1 putative RNA polymerase sigma factor FecI [Achromobacter veterisilvae]
MPWEYIVPIEASSPNLESLYCSHHGWLLGWLRRRLGDSFDAADLAHDTFIRLMRAPRDFDNGPEARAYLRTIANGMCIDLWRRRQIEQAWLDELAARPEASAPSAEHQAIVLEALHEIDAMLRSLPVKAANAFIMAVACEMTDKEVAQALGVSDRMVRKYVAQAMLHCLQLEARQMAAGPVSPAPSAGPA